MQETVNLFNFIKYLLIHIIYRSYCREIRNVDAGNNDDTSLLGSLINKRGCYTNLMASHTNEQKEVTVATRWWRIKKKIW